MNKMLVISSIILSLLTTAFAQNIPTQKITQTDFELKKGLSQIATVAYQGDSAGYNPTTLKVIQFDAQGNISYDYFRIIGKSASETVNKYVYKDGRVDSVNTKASAASFNTDSKYHYNGKNWLDSVTCKGPRVSFTDIYTQDKQGRLTSVKRLHVGAKVGFIERYYYDSNGQLEYTEKKDNDSPMLTSFYKGKDKLFTIELGNDTLTFCNTNNGDFRAYAGQMTKAKMQALRKKSIDNPKDYADTIIQPLMAKANYLYVIPVNTKAESGELIKRYVIEQAFGESRYYLFSKHVYQDKRIVGTTDFDSFFQMQVERRGLHKMKWK